AWVRTGAIAVGELVSPDRGTSGVIALVICLAIAGVLALPNASSFFHARDDRPLGVVVAVLLIGFIAWDFALIGIALLPQRQYDSKDLPLGILLLIASV